MRKITITAIKVNIGMSIAMILLTFAFSVNAQLCVTREALVRGLHKEYGEYRMVTAVTEKGHILEIFVATQRQTWTAFFSHPVTKCTRPIASGQGIQIVLPKDPET